MIRKMHRRFLLLALLGRMVLASGLGLTEPSAAPLASLPSCAANCSKSAMPVSSCAPGNLTCLCGDQQFATVLEACVVSTCTTKEQLATKNATEAACGVAPRDRGRTLYVLAVALGVVTAAVVLLRLGFRALVGGAGLAADDWAVLASLLVGLPGTVLVCLGTVPNGAGRDVWTLTPDQVTRFGLWFYLSEIQYFANLAAVKLSLLLFYLRIFPSRIMRRLLWGTVVFDVLFGAGFVATAVVQCMPIDYFWHMWDGEHRGHCININAMGWANAIISIALDFWMLALPLSQLRSLRLHWRKKAAVALMFIVGTFVTVVSILRLQALLTFATSSNLTYDNFDVHLWSTIEINVAIVCACMPAMRQVLVWLFPVVFGGGGGATTTPRGYSRYGSGATPGPKGHPQHPHRRRRQGPGSESRAALAGPGSRDLVGTIGVQEIRVQRRFEVQDEESPGSPVQMTEFVSTYKSGGM